MSRVIEKPSWWSRFLHLFVGFDGPLAFAVSSASNSIIIGPNVMPLVLSRLHRWTLGQAVTFFDNDFAGRIATKQMQAARAVTDVVTEMINTVAFALASIIGSVIYLMVIDRWIAGALAGLIKGRGIPLLYPRLFRRLKIRPQTHAAGQAKHTQQKQSARSRQMHACTPVD